MKITIVIDDQRPPCEIDRWEIERIRREREERRNKKLGQIPDDPTSEFFMEQGWQKDWRKKNQP